MPFVYKNDHFAKTGSGQTEGKHSKKDAFLQAQPTQEQQEYLNALPLQDQVRKRIF